MTQLPGGAQRRTRVGGSLDVYTALALAGTVALIVAVAILWITGQEWATELGGAAKEMPWKFLQ